MAELVRSGEASPHEAAKDTAKILIYSDDRTTRAEVRTSVGRRPGKGAPRIEWFEAATEFGVFDLIRQHSFDLLIFDGEASKIGGMGLARQVKDEVQDAPPVLVLIARQQDEWLARWSEAERAIMYPINPREIQRAVTELLAGSR